MTPTTSNPSPESSPFAFVCCQHGAEGALKSELLEQGWRLAFSRPGFVTFKRQAATAPDEASPAESSSPAKQSDESLPSGIFVRHAAWSIGKVTGAESEALTQQIAEQIGQADLPAADVLHLWQRDRLPVGERGFMPGEEPLTEAIAQFLATRLHDHKLVASPAANQVARTGDRVLDIVMVEPNQWWIGWHMADRAEARWPGGVFPMRRDRPVVSRAYFKTAEAIAWSGLPLRDGDRAIEVGSAPGGSVQRLLELGLHVTGIDPAEMDESIQEHPNYKHVRARGGDIKRYHYAKARWLLVDSNVKPEQTLTTVKNIVTHERTSIEGLLITLKLGTYDRAVEIPVWLDEIRSWGYSQLQARQLAGGRTEICVAAQVRR